MKKIGKLLVNLRPTGITQPGTLFNQIAVKKYQIGSLRSLVTSTKQISSIYATWLERIEQKNSKAIYPCSTYQRLYLTTPLARSILG